MDDDSIFHFVTLHHNRKNSVNNSFFAFHTFPFHRIPKFYVTIQDFHASTIFNTCVSAGCLYMYVYMSACLSSAFPCLYNNMRMHEAAKNTRLFWRICLSFRFVLSFSFPFSVFLFFCYCCCCSHSLFLECFWWPRNIVVVVVVVAVYVMFTRFCFCWDGVRQTYVYHFEILFSMLLSRFNGNTLQIEDTRKFSRWCWCLRVCMSLCVCVLIVIGFTHQMVMFIW